MTNSNSPKEFYERIQKEIKRDAALSHVFKKVWSDPSYAAFFFLHPDELLLRFKENNEPNFPSIDFSMPHLYFATKPDGELDYVFTILEAAANDSDIKRDMATDSLEQADLKWIVERIPAVVLFYVLRFLDNNPHISALSQKGETLTLTDVHKIIEDRTVQYKLPDFSSLDVEWKSSIKTGRKKIASSQATAVVPADPILSELVRKTVKTVDDFFGKVMASGRGLQMAFSALNEARIALMLLSAYEKQHSRIPDYERILTSLYLNKVINNSLTIFLCTQCADEPFLSVSRSRLAPKDLGMLCLRCKKKTLCATAYDLHDTLLECIQSKDHMLAVAIAMLFHEKRIAYDAGVSLSNREIDFIAMIHGKKTLVECKVFRKFRNADSFEEVIANSLRQISEQINAARTCSIELGSAMLVINQQHEYQEQARRKAARQSLETNFEIEIHDPQSFCALLNKH